MLPHERSLVERMKDRPFALIGIDTDADDERYREQAAEAKITWRNAMEGSPGGAIPKRWGVRGYPTLYLIDAEGKVREVWLGNPGDEVLDRAVDALVAEAESKAKSLAPGAPKQGSSESGR